MRLKLILGVFVLLLLIGGAVTAVYLKSEIKRKETMVLNFFGGPQPPGKREAIERHLGLTQRSGKDFHPDYTPVHIVSREDKSSPWMFGGTGTLLNKTGTLLTAVHVLERDTPVEFGYRLIGAPELNGTALVKPIVGIIDMGDIGDAVACSTGKDGVFSFFPVIPKKYSGRPAAKTDERFGVRVAPPNIKIRLLTEPDRVIRCLAAFKPSETVTGIIFEFDVQPGESGTGAIIEGGEYDEFMVVTHHHLMNGEALKSFGYPDEKPRVFGLGHILKIDYH